MLLYLSCTLCKVSQDLSEYLQSVQQNKKLTYLNKADCTLCCGIVEALDQAEKIGRKVRIPSKLSYWKLLCKISWELLKKVEMNKRIFYYVVAV